MLSNNYKMTELFELVIKIIPTMAHTILKEKYLNTANKPKLLLLKCFYPY